MTEISEAAKMKADELFGTTSDRLRLRDQVARFIQQVSDAAKGALDFADYTREAGYRHEAHEELKADLASLILPEPVDPLSAAMQVALDHAKADGADDDTLDDHRAGFHYLREALAKRGLKIVEDKS